MSIAYKIIPYKQGSKGAKALAKKLGGKSRVLRLVGGSYRRKKGSQDVVINWGNSDPGEDILSRCGADYSPVLNGLGPYIERVANKLEFFSLMTSVGLSEIIPDFYRRKEDIPDEAFPVFCRTHLSGHSGSGIVVADDRAGLVDCQLYVRYLKKKDEYRVHIGKGLEGTPKIIAVQRKAKRNGAEEPVNWKIRSHGNGFVFVRNNVSPPPCVIEVATKSFEASSLDFGAVDVIYNEHEERAWVLEINTAPGLEGQTIVDYANFFYNYTK